MKMISVFISYSFYIQHITIYVYLFLEKLSLITKVECEESKSTQEEADQLLCAAPKVEEKKPTAEDTDANELV